MSKPRVDLMRPRQKTSFEPKEGTHKSPPLQLVLDKIDALEHHLKSIEQLLRSRHHPTERSRGKFTDDTFQPLADLVLGHKRTLLGQDRLFVLWQCIRNVAPSEVPAVEVGAYRGGSAYFIASAFRTLRGQELPFHVIDTFQGHPSSKISEFDPFHKAGMFADIGYEDVKAYLSEFMRLQVHKGEFSEMAPRLSDPAYCFVHVDVDLYQTTLECLDYFGERLVDGGVIVVDDFGAKKCPGVEKAVTKYLGGHHLFQVWQMPTEQLLIIRS